MRTHEDQISTQENDTPSVSPGNYSSVTVYMEDTLGVVFLGVLTIILLIGWLRAEARNREIIVKER